MAADKLISGGGPWESAIGYSRATVAGDYVHVSGSTASIGGEVQHEGDAYGQTLVALNDVIAPALAQVGYSLADVVRSRVYLVNASDVDAAAKAHGEVFGEIRPAATMVAGVTMVDPKSWWRSKWTPGSAADHYCLAPAPPRPSAASSTPSPSVSLLLRLVPRRHRRLD
ncbi:MAG: RidA family protein [Mycobacterium sp.]